VTTTAQTSRLPDSSEALLAPVIGGAASPPALVLWWLVAAFGLPAGRGFVSLTQPSHWTGSSVSESRYHARDIPPTSVPSDRVGSSGGLHTTTCRGKSPETGAELTLERIRDPTYMVRVRSCWLLWSSPKLQLEANSLERFPASQSRRRSLQSMLLPCGAR
jgi:hypothetical protein